MTARLQGQVAGPTALDGLCATVVREIARAPDPCLDSIPPERLQRVPVYLYGEPTDSSARRLAPQADLLAQEVAAMLRVLLGATDSLPRGEPRVTWRSLPRDLVVTTRPDGRMTRASARAEAADDAGANPLLLQAFDTAARGGTIILWPERYAAESLVVVLKLAPAWFGPDRQLRFPPSHTLFPAFTMDQPRVTTAVLKRAATPSYPVVNEEDGVDGVVVMQFIVDTLGKAEPSSVRDTWPETKPRLTGDLAAYYRRFVERARQAVLDSRFEPARVDRCPVRQLVQQPYVFKMRKR